MAGQYSGLYRGIVTNAMDPQKAGRAQVRLPQFAIGDDLWAGTCTAFGAPPGSGPRVGDEVWVMFESGDLARPVVLGKAR